MTNPPRGSDQPGPADPDRHPTEPVPSFDRPQQPAPPYGPPQHPSQPYGPPSYGPPSYGQPPYGQAPFGQPSYGPAGPPYGPAQPPPAPKSRVGLIAAVTAGLLVLIALVVVLAMTMSSTVLDRNAVQADVAAQFEEREGVAVDLSCTEEMTVEVGATYECTGTTADGEDVTLQIAVTDEETAAYTWSEP